MPMNTQDTTYPPMRILCVSHTADLKGSAMSLTQLMIGLHKSRFMPVALFHKNGPLVREMQSHGIATYVIQKKGFLRVSLIREALDLIKKEGIDLVHLNSAVPFCKYVGIAAWLKGLKVVWHLREDPDGKRVQNLKKWIRLLADRIFVVSTQLERVFSQSDKVVKVYNGVDTTKFTTNVSGAPFRKRFGLSGEAFIFAIVGSIEENKGTTVFLEAAETICQSAGNVFFIVVGHGLPDDVERIHRFLRERPSLQQRTILTGRQENMPEVMAAVDVLVMASLGGNENFPRVLIEAMASGKATIATDVGEVFRIVDDDITGFIVPRNDVAALARAMRTSLEMQDALKEMGRKAREKAVSEFTLEKHVECVQNEYGRLLSTKSLP